MENGIQLIKGGSHADARGCLRFCNDFDMSLVKRFYTVSNSVSEPKRGWIMHKRETKWFFPLKGTTIIHIDSDQSFVLSADDPVVLQVPPGNWFCIEQDGNAEVQVFSNCFVGEFADDNFRRPL